MKNKIQYSGIFLLLCVFSSPYFFFPNFTLFIFSSLPPLLGFFLFVTVSIFLYSLFGDFLLFFENVSQLSPDIYPKQHSGKKKSLQVKYINSTCSREAFKKSKVLCRLKICCVASRPKKRIHQRKNPGISSKEVSQL